MKFFLFLFLLTFTKADSQIGNDTVHIFQSSSFFCSEMERYREVSTSGSTQDFLTDDRKLRNKIENMFFDNSSLRFRMVSRMGSKVRITTFSPNTNHWRRRRSRIKLSSIHGFLSSWSWNLWGDDNWYFQLMIF